MGNASGNQQQMPMMTPNMQMPINNQMNFPMLNLNSGMGNGMPPLNMPNLNNFGNATPSVPNMMTSASNMAMNMNMNMNIQNIQSMNSMPNAAMNANLQSPMASIPNFNQFGNANQQQFGFPNMNMQMQQPNNNQMNQQQRNNNNKRY